MTTSAPHVLPTAVGGVGRTPAADVLNPARVAGPTSDPRQATLVAVDLIGQLAGSIRAGRRWAGSTSSGPASSSTTSRPRRSSPTPAELRERAGGHLPC